MPPTSPLTAAAARDELVHDRFASRLWKRDPTLFGDALPRDVQGGIRDRLGWLDAAGRVEDDAKELDAFARAIRTEGLREVYLLGMGGSSLCAEVFRDVSTAEQSNAPVRLTVVDTTDEKRIGDLTTSLRPERSLFIVASKSGSTIEVTALERHFWALMAQAAGDGAGSHFVAITDPSTSLAALAKSRGYRQTFINPPDIGGRYSVLSRFGLVPAALLGVDLGSLGSSAANMAALCREDSPDNPGLTLGAFMAAHARSGRDKLTIVTSPALAAFGPWIEQLVAESTGKGGSGVLPIVGEPRGDADDYGADRAFVTIASSADEELASWKTRIEQAGHPVFHIDCGPEQLGAEFFRWEFATAAAGALLGVNPFDQPDVEAAKQLTRSQIQAFTSTGVLRIDPPLVSDDVYRLREHRAASSKADGRYLAILDYLPADAQRTDDMSEMRRVLRDSAGLATTHGIGPRYLHSTGQYHKGGPNTGRFLLVTSDDATITLIPDSGYSFSVLKHAQALGDFDALVAAGRDVLHVHFPDPAIQTGPILLDLTQRWLAG